MHYPVVPQLEGQTLAASERTSALWRHVLGPLVRDISWSPSKSSTAASTSSRGTVTMRLVLRCCVLGCSVLTPAVFACASLFAQSYDPALIYTQRGNHWEGLRAIPIGGTIELLSARVVVEQQRPPVPAAWGDRARLRFYLPKEDVVTVTVRQLRSRSTYYVMDGVRAAWRAGVLNEYAWPTAPVIRRLTDMRPEDLGAVVNLGPGKATNRETVLPAVLFEDAAEGGPKMYRFTLKSDGGANVDVGVYSGARRVFHRDTNREEAGSPFTVLWSASGAAEGWYRLVLTGQFDDGTKVDKEVNFYHGTVISRTEGKPQ